MNDTVLDDALLALLRSVDTPTVCNAIEVAQGKRGFNDFTRGTMLCSDPDGGAIVGYAVTAKIAAVEPPSEAPDVIRARRMAYYKAMAKGPRPSVAVVEDLDYVSSVFEPCALQTAGLMRLALPAPGSGIFSLYGIRQTAPQESAMKAQSLSC